MAGVPATDHRSGATRGRGPTAGAASLAGGLQRSYLTATALILLVLQIPLALLFARAEYADLATESIGIANAVARHVGPDLVLRDRGVLARITDAYGAPDTSILVFDLAGAVVAESSLPGHPTTLHEHPDVQRALQGIDASSPTAHERGPDWISIALPLTRDGEVVGAVEVVRSSAGVERRVRTLVAGLAAVTVATLAGVAALGSLLTRWATRSLDDLERAAGRWREGELTVAADLTTGPVEIRRLGATFDRMAAQLAAMIEARESFLAYASHQLRLPLTAHRLRLANLEAHVDTVGRRGLAALERDVDDFGDRLDQLLLLAHPETHRDVRGLADPRALLLARAAFWEPVARRHGVTLRLAAGSLPVDVAVEEFPGALEQVLDNLLGNALRATSSGGVVELDVVAAQGVVEVVVTDDGPGMSADERARAFDAFWRAPGTTGPGAGLGLGIVRRLVEAMDGTIELRDAAGGGLRAVVRLAAVTIDDPDPPGGRRPSSAGSVS